MHFETRGWMVVALCVATCAGARCAGPAPKLFPPAPIQIVSRADDRIERRYDTDGDGRGDFAEVLGVDGRVAVLRFRIDGEDAIDVDWSSGPTNRDTRHLIVLLDSIPYSMVRAARDGGRFRLFHPPARVISPFPVMTDLSFAEFFGLSPSRAVEAQYYNGRFRNQGVDDYLAIRNSPWPDHVDYHLPFVAHALVYLRPDAWFDHELRRMQERFLAERPRRFVAYGVGTSALGARSGRNGHHRGLVRLDRWCRQIVHATQGGVQITLLSDHGHDLVLSRRIELIRSLERFGYRVRDSIRRSCDVVVTQFGPVTSASIYTRVPDRVAADVVGIEGVELAAYRVEDRIVVLSRNGRAEIEQSSSRYRYATEFGDPLELAPIVRALQQHGAIDAEGFIADESLFAATVAHVFPDPLHRLWRAFNGLVEYTPDVLLSLEDGWHWGGATLSAAIDLSAAHGSLRQSSSVGFAMTTAGPLPESVRMQDLRATLHDVGVPIQVATEQRAVVIRGAAVD